MSQGFVMRAEHVEFLILALIREQGRHVYAIRQMLADKTGSAAQASFGLLYPLLRKMKRQGWVKSHETRLGARVRVVYSLTPSGKQELQDRKSQWRDFLRHMNNVV